MDLKEQILKHKNKYSSYYNDLCDIFEITMDELLKTLDTSNYRIEGETVIILNDDNNMVYRETLSENRHTRDFFNNINNEIVVREYKSGTLIPLGLDLSGRLEMYTYNDENVCVNVDIYYTPQ